MCEMLERIKYTTVIQSGRFLPCRFLLLYIFNLSQFISLLKKTNPSLLLGIKSIKHKKQEEHHGRYYFDQRRKRNTRRRKLLFLAPAGRLGRRLLGWRRIVFYHRQSNYFHRFVTSPLCFKGTGYLWSAANFLYAARKNINPLSNDFIPNKGGGYQSV